MRFFERIIHSKYGVDLHVVGDTSNVDAPFTLAAKHGGLAIFAYMSWDDMLELHCEVRSAMRAYAHKMDRESAEGSPQKPSGGTYANGAEKWKDRTAVRRELAEEKDDS